MRTFKEFLNEKWIPPKEIAQAIRNYLKLEYKLTSRDVGVRATSGSSVTLTIKSFKAYKYIKELERLALKHENINWDKATGEILQGANLYVFVEKDGKFNKELRKKVTEYIFNFIKKNKDKILSIVETNHSIQIIPDIYLVWNSNHKKFSIFGQVRTIKIEDLTNKEEIEYKLASDLILRAERQHIDYGNDKPWKALLKIIGV